MSESPIRVVLADDVPQYRSLIRIILEVEGKFEVVGEAADGIDAVELSAQHQPDVAVVDLAMPFMDGLQAIPKILAASPDTKVVVLSGFSRVQVEQKALAAGASAYLEKGEAPSSIVATIAAVVGRRTPAVLGSNSND